MLKYKKYAFLGAFMDNRTRFNERKTELLLEYLNQNKRAVRGKKIVTASLYTILLLRAALTLFEIPVFIIQGKPVNLTAIILFIPLLIVLRVIAGGAKGFTYVILVSSTARLIAYFALVYKTMPQDSFTDIYSFILFAVLMIQFFLSLLLLISYDCDTYFTALQRITIKVQGEELLRKKEEQDGTQA